MTVAPDAYPFPVPENQHAAVYAEWGARHGRQTALRDLTYRYEPAEGWTLKRHAFKAASLALTPDCGLGPWFRYARAYVAAYERFTQADIAGHLFSFLRELRLRGAVTKAAEHDGEYVAGYLDLLGGDRHAAAEIAHTTTAPHTP